MQTVVPLAQRLAIHRIAFLKPSEKRLLEAAVEKGLELRKLGFSELERLVSRLLRAKTFNPELALEEAERDRRYLEAAGLRFLSAEDEEYPPLLREIHEPPYGLFVRGATLDNRVPSLALVGTRSATRRGDELAAAFGRDACLAGLPLVSGLARGIDAAAHRGALAARRLSTGAGPTVAVLPVGIDSIYPPSHRGLAASILEGEGSLVSEYPPGTGPGAWRFPERNRIIAGIARAVLVVEAPLGSGALITAGQALESGRDVFVARPLLGGAMNGGADRLAGEGAPALASLDEVLSEWGFSIKRPLQVPEARRNADRTGDEAGEGEAALLAESLRAELGLPRHTFATNPREAGARGPGSTSTRGLFHG